MAQGSSAGLVNDLAAQIRARIMTGEYAIGSRLPQEHLAVAFGTSRTPIREALRQLESTGLVEHQANRGAIVRIPTPWEIREAYEIRADLEALATRRATARLDHVDVAALRATVLEHDRFHQTIAAASASGRLHRMLTHLDDAFPRHALAMVIDSDSRLVSETAMAHKQITDAIESRDPDRAASLMHAHVLGLGDRFAAWFERHSSTIFTP